MHPILKLLRQAKYHQSTVAVSKLPNDVGVEFAFMGRSNAGKSSVINALTGIQIAKTSKTPGRTQCMNVFVLDAMHRLVDFPGYGYAKLPIKLTQKWQDMVKRYLKKRQSLSVICIVMDIRHPLQPADLNFLEHCHRLQQPIHILLNKADKLSKNQAQATLLKVRKSPYLTLLPNCTVQLFSARSQLGLADLGEQLQTFANQHHNTIAQFLRDGVPPSDAQHG